jgi:cytochrome c biogenesis protein
MKGKDFIESLWKKLASIKLAIALFIIIAAISMIGTFLVQNRPPEEYIRLFGVVGYKIMDFLGFFDLYHSFWFRLILLLFAMNLILCSIERLPSVINFLKSRPFIKTPSGFKNFSVHFEYKTDEPYDLIKKRIEEVLRNNGFKTSFSENFFYGRKGVVSRFGPYITHLGIIVILAGAYMGSVFGFRANVNLLEGESTNMIYEARKFTPIPLGFLIKCTKFRLEKYPNSDVPKEYISEIEVYEDGKLVLKKNIEVNHPLTYKGLKFYQASYGTAGLKEITLLVKKEDKTFEVSFTSNEEKEVDGIRMKVEKFIENYMGMGPAVILSISDGGRRKTIPIFQDKRMGEIHKGISALDIEIKNLEPLYYTGLEVTKDPGVNIVWLGCTLGILGMILSFFIPVKRIYVSIFEEDKKKLVMIGGSVLKGKELSFVEKIYKELKGGI